MRLARFVLSCALTAALLPGATAQATVMIPTDLADVTTAATLIVRGRVIDTRAFTDVANGPVMTAVTVGIIDVLKGTAERTVTFRVHGGDLGRYRHVLVGAPTFAVGDEAFVFLKRSSAGVLWPVGSGSGVYKVAVASGALVVNPPVVAERTATVGAPLVRGDVRRKPMPVSDFAGIVRLLLAARTESRR